MVQTYESLSDEEKAAFWGRLVADDRLGRLRLEQLSPRWSESTYYRNYKDGMSSLQQKGFIDSSYNPTTIALQILPQPILEEALDHLRNKTRNLEQEHQELRNKVCELENEVRNLRSQEVQFIKQIENIKPLSNLIEDFEKIGVNDNWIRASIALNLVEPAIKKKLEELEVKLPTKTQFSDIYEQLQQVLKEKENRELKYQLLTPKEFYHMRSQIDHWGHRYTSLSKVQADYIVNLVTDFLSDVLG
jgi:Tfp pilus assembly protein PilO